MSRPLDYGDPYPSDVGDVPPIDTTDLAYEVEYIIRKKKNTKPFEDGVFKPDFMQPNIPTKVRDAHVGLIIKKKDPLAANEPPTFEVLRQDGFKGEVVTTKKPGGFRQVQIGDPAVVVGLQERNRFGLVVEEKQVELPCLELGCADTTVTGPTNIPFADILNQTGEDVGDVLDFGGDSILVKKANRALYHLEWNVSMTVNNPADVANEIEVRSGCVPQAISKNKYISLIKKSGLRVGPGPLPADPNAIHITIQCDEVDYMPYEKFDSVTNTAEVTWSPNPRLGGNIMLGTRATQSWLKLNAGSSARTWLGNGNATIRYKFPNQGPTSVGQTLMVEAFQLTTGTGGHYCVQLQHGPVGVNGTFTVSYNGSTLGTLSFINGICVSGNNLLPPYSSGPVICPDNTLTDWNPCP